jgi:lysophospholipid acyltransferase (LPLAT)-like uncharacterized protein
VTEAATHDANSNPSVELSRRRFTLRQRFELKIISWLGYGLIRLIGSTLRIAVSLEDGAPEGPGARPVVAAFWHNCIIPATYACRDYGIHVMNSSSYDGEYIARIIQKFGYVPVRGSSSRHAVRALLGLRRALDAGSTVAFTIDGPRGPRYKVKPGPVALARSSGKPLVMFHLAVEKAWVLNSWDRMMIPKPFSRVLARIGKKIFVPADASDSDLESYTAELQASLDRVREFAEKHVGEAGGVDFPFYKRPE